MYYRIPKNILASASEQNVHGSSMFIQIYQDTHARERNLNIIPHIVAAER
jgi:hypothetical protein